MKKFIICLLAILLSTTLVFSAATKSKPSDYKLGIKYEQALKSDKPSILLFYTDWCTFCRNFMPTYETIGNTYKDKYNLVMVNVEKNELLARDYTVTGYPTLYIIDPKIDNRVHLDNGIYGSKILLQRELDRYLNVRARLK